MKTVEDFDGLLRKIARERTRPQPWLFEDAWQEARVAVWQLLAKTPDAEPWLVAVTAKRAAIGVGRGRALTGEPRKPTGSGWRAREGSARDVSLDAVIEAADAEGARIPASLISADFSDAVVDREAVRCAIALLPEDDREIVLARFYAEETYPEIARRTGRSVDALKSRWSGGIAPALRELLAA